VPEVAAPWPGLDESSPKGAAPRLPRESMSSVAAAPERVSATISPMPPAAAPSSSVARPSTGARRLAGPLAPAEGDERRDEARRVPEGRGSGGKLCDEKKGQEGREPGVLSRIPEGESARSRQLT